MLYIRGYINDMTVIGKYVVLAVHAEFLLPRSHFTKLLKLCIMYGIK